MATRHRKKKQRKIGQIVKPSQNCVWQKRILNATFANDVQIMYFLWMAVAALEI